MNTSVVLDEITRPNVALLTTDLSTAAERQDRYSQAISWQRESQPVSAPIADTRLETNPYYHGGINE